jgi:hypothetical protein
MRLGELARDRPDLHADLGYGDNLPERATRHRPQRKQSRVRGAIGANQPCLAVNGKPQTLGIGTRKPIGDQLAEQRLGRTRQIPLRAAQLTTRRTSIVPVASAPRGRKSARTARPSATSANGFAAITSS